MSFDLEETFGFALHHGSYLFKTAMKANFAKAKINLTSEEFILLFLIPGTGIEQSELIIKTKKDKTNITRLLTRLVNKKYLKRKESENRRHQQIFLTSTGEKMKAKLMPVVLEFIARITKNIPPKSLEITRQTLNQLSKNLQKDD